MNKRKLLIVALNLSLLGVMASGSANAQSITSPGTASSKAVAHEIIVVGTIRQVLAESAPGHAPGLNLVLASPQGIFDVSAGPYLASDVKDSLSAGQQIQVAGVLHSSNGQTILLARQMNIAGREIAVRNQHGFLVRSALPTASRSQRSQVGLTGGNQ